MKLKELLLVCILVFGAGLIVSSLYYDSKKKKPEVEPNDKIIVEEILTMMTEEELHLFYLLLQDHYSEQRESILNDPFIFQNFDPRLLPDNCSLRDKYTWFYDQDGKFVVVGPEGIWYDGDFSANAGHYGEGR